MFIVAEAELSSAEKTTRGAVNRKFYILYSVRVFPLSFVSASYDATKHAQPIFVRGQCILEGRNSYLREARERSSIKRN